MNGFFRLVKAIIIGNLALVLPANEIWAAGSGGGISGEVFWQSISFVLLIVLLIRVLKKPVSSFLSKRQEEIKNSLEQAAKKEIDSQTNFKEWEKKLDVLSQEVAELHQRISRDGQTERQRIIERAKEEGDRIRKQAQVVAEQEVKKARAELKKEMIDLSVDLAEKLLKDATQPKDQERLAKEFIGKVGELR